MKASHAIVAGVDLESPAGAVTLKKAVVYSAAAQALHVIGVLEPEGDLLESDHVDPGRLGALLRQLEAAATESAQPLASHCELYVHARWGDPAEQIVHLGAEANADLIVVGAPRASERLRGSVTEKVCRWAACPALVARPVDWVSTEEGLVPRLPICVPCLEARSHPRHPHWFCQGHRDPTRRQISVLDMD